MTGALRDGLSRRGIPAAHELSGVHPDGPKREREKLGDANYAADSTSDDGDAEAAGNNDDERGDADDAAELATFHDEAHTEGAESDDQSDYQTQIHGWFSLV